MNKKHATPKKLHRDWPSNKQVMNDLLMVIEEVKQGSRIIIQVNNHHCWKVSGKYDQF